MTGHRHKGFLRDVSASVSAEQRPWEAGGSAATPELCNRWPAIPCLCWPATQSATQYSGIVSRGKLQLLR